MNVGGRGCSDSRRHTVNLMNVPCNTSTLHHGVQQNSYRSWAFFASSHVNQRLDCWSRSSDEALPHTPVSPLNLHISDSNHFALASLSARLTRFRSGPPQCPLILVIAHLSSCGGDHLVLRLLFKVHRKQSNRAARKTKSSCHGKETHVHTPTAD